MTILRTPDERFQHLPSYPFAPHYLGDLPGLEGLRLHYLDEGGPPGAPVALCLHGEPSWSYLYRTMIPVFVEAGMRVIAPDLFGFGRSDKPAEDSAYSFDFHRRTLLALVRRLELRDITLVVQDWGGLLGLTLPLEAPERYTRLIAMNTALATGDLPLGPGFLAWRAHAAAHRDLDVAALFAQSSPGLSSEVAAAYAAPFPDVRFKAGVRAFPQLVPDRPDAPGAELSRRARVWWQTEWAGQSFMAVGMRDGVLGPAAMAYLHSLIRGCPPPLEIPEGGHFVQEDAGELIARRALQSFGLLRTPAQEG
ncbi:haloalkane dehalogenase [Deinococcus koreensis]|uniref:Haloalkane dehalogenase n=1 Tax=Deinococcus koreensis TaxID=2054903 RepID=A0A2K3USQ7_9DEIO|nr:haloalkane dehalogenase [Deinococcus koreensis]PNY79540.1 haloalkane dehalogenase [Deinococcus koreensis]